MLSLLPPPMKMSMSYAARVFKRDSTSFVLNRAMPGGRNRVLGYAKRARYPSSCSMTGPHRFTSPSTPNLSNPILRRWSKLLAAYTPQVQRSEEHTSELQSLRHLV